MESPVQHYPRVCIYKPRRDGNGCASQWEYSPKRQCTFLMIAAQSGTDDKGNAKFGWDAKRTMKLKNEELGDIVSVIRGKKTGVGPWDKDKDRFKGFFHKGDGWNTSLTFVTGSMGGFYLKMTTQTDGQTNSWEHGITDGEAEVLEVFLAHSILVSVGF